jgi:hypothetical protein
MLVPLAILFGSLLTVTTALAIGRLILRQVPVELYRDEENALGFVAGSAVLSFVIFFLCALGWARKGVFLALAAAAIGLAVRFGAHRNIRPRFTPVPKFWRRLFLAGFFVFTVLYFFSAMAPEFSPDGVSYHLSFVAKYNLAHGFVRIPTNLYAQLSQGVELLYLMAFSFGRHSAAALVHYAFLLALALAILSYGRRIGYPVAGAAAALLVYASPVVGMDGTTAYIDVAVAAILFALYYLVQLWDRQRSTALLLVIGLVAGFGYAAKYTAVLAIPYAMGFVAWRSRRMKPALMVGLCSTVLIAPWIIKNVVWVGNPLSPMFNQWFPNPYVHIGMERAWRTYLTHYNLQNRWTIPLEITMRGESLCGFLGPVFLLIPLGLFALRVREGRRILAAAALFTLPYFANIGTRFFIPPLPFWSLALAITLLEMRLLLGAVVVLHLVLSWPGVARLYTAEHPWMLGRILAKQALRIESEDHWLSRKQPDYQIAKLFESKAPAGSRIFTMNGMPESYTTREVWVRFQSARVETMGDMFFAAFLGDFQPKCGERLAFAPATLRKLRVVETAPRAGDAEWSISEFRIFVSGSEIARRPAWRITSRPNPWEIQLAFDNSPVTRWRSWQPFEPGMYVELDLDDPHVIDAVQLESPYDCTAHELRVEGLTADGRWETLANKRTIIPLNPPSFMGKAAMREMKLRGVDYLFIREGEFGYAETFENPAAWGLTLTGTAAGGRLYRLDAGYPILMSNDHGTILSRR